METHIESEVPDEEEDSDQDKRLPESENRPTKIIVSNDQQSGKCSNIKQIQTKKESQSSSPSASPSKTSSKVLTPAGKIRGNFSKNHKT